MEHLGEEVDDYETQYTALKENIARYMDDLRDTHYIEPPTDWFENDCAFCNHYVQEADDLHCNGVDCDAAIPCQEWCSKSKRRRVDLFTCQAPKCPMRICSDCSLCVGCAGEKKDL